MKGWGSLLLLAAAISPTQVGAPPDCTSSRRDGLLWFRCDQDSLWIVETRRPLQVAFSATDVPSLRERLRRSPGLKLVLNGNYHDGDYDQPTMVGWTRLGTTELAKLRPDDPQLTRVLTIGVDGQIQEILHARHWLERIPEQARAKLQTGPAITENGAVMRQEIAGSLNGSDPYKRTAIGRTRGGATVIVIARTPRSLAGLGETMLSVNDYRARGLTLVNLDGGPSTGIHSDRVRGLSYGADKVTPIVIGVER